MNGIIFNQEIAQQINSGNIEHAVRSIRYQKIRQRSTFFNLSTCMDFIFQNIDNLDDPVIFNYWLQFIFELTQHVSLNAENIFSNILTRLSMQPEMISGIKNKTALACWCLEQREFSILDFKLLSSSFKSSLLMNNVVASLIVDQKMSRESLVKLTIFFLKVYNRRLFLLVYGALLLEGFTVPELDIFQTEIYRLQRYPQKVSDKLNKIMIQLRCGLDNISSAQDNAAAFILAAIREEKKIAYEFLPVILHYGEFSRYLTLVNGLAKPARSKFIITGRHWAAGEIEVTDHRVSIFLSDSLGYTGSENACWFNQLLLSKTDFNDIFSNIPVTVYYSYETRQKDAVSCNIYALDDLRHLYTCMDYVPESELRTAAENAAVQVNSVSQAKIFAFLNRTIEVKRQINDIDLFFCKIPLSLLRTIQSTKIQPNLAISKNYAINKSKHTFFQSFVKDFVDNEDGKQLNLRTERKFDLMIQRLERCIAKFLNDNPETGIDHLFALANEHSLNGYAQRCTTTGPRSICL